MLQADPNFVVCLLEFIEGGGPASGIYDMFCAWMKEEMGYADKEITTQSAAIRRAAGQRPD